ARIPRVPAGRGASATTRNASVAFDGATCVPFGGGDFTRPSSPRSTVIVFGGCSPRASNERKTGSKRRASASREGPARVRRLDERPQHLARAAALVARDVGGHALAHELVRAVLRRRRRRFLVAARSEPADAEAHDQPGEQKKGAERAVSEHGGPRRDDPRVRA